MSLSSEFNREFNGLLLEDLSRWVDQIPSSSKGSSLPFESNFEWLVLESPAVNGADVRLIPKEQTVEQLLKQATKKLRTACIPHFLKVTMYLRVCCLAVQQTLAPEQQDVLGNIYHTLLQWLWECEPDWWDQCTITDTYKIASHNPRIRDLLRPLEEFTNRLSEV